jgi:hypothetical protein
LTDPALRERAALDVLMRPPEWWRVGPATYDPGTRRWSITARSRPGGRLRPPETLTGRAEDELHAMADAPSGFASIQLANATCARGPGASRACTW